uniref:Secreted protein n=1 Tax=Glossina pallidipes TaxID=7398 RepID=A0A1A9ZVP7_GLOPL
MTCLSLGLQVLMVALLTSSTRLSAKPLTSYNVGLSRFVVVCSFQQLLAHHDGVKTTKHCQRVNADAEKKLSLKLLFLYWIRLPHTLCIGSGSSVSSSKFPDIALFKAAFASSILPSVLMRNDVRTTANKVALKNTVPSEFNGIFIDTKRLQAIRCGHNLPNPKGGEIFLNNVTTSKCLIRPLASGSYSDQRRMNSSK